LSVLLNRTWVDCWMVYIISKYGNYISALVQVIMYLFAAEYLIGEYFVGVSAAHDIILTLVFVIVPLVFSTYASAKYALTFISSD
jgi:hypothetical protein